jgi:hypothetical protein
VREYSTKSHICKYFTEIFFISGQHNFYPYTGKISSLFLGKDAPSWGTLSQVWENIPQFGEQFPNLGKSFPKLGGAFQNLGKHPPNWRAISQHWELIPQTGEYYLSIISVSYFIHFNY